MLTIETEEQYQHSVNWVVRMQRSRERIAAETNLDPTQREEEVTELTLTIEALEREVLCYLACKHSGIVCILATDGRTEAVQG